LKVVGLGFVCWQTSQPKTKVDAMAIKLSRMDNIVDVVDTHKCSVTIEAHGHKVVFFPFDPNGIDANSPGCDVSIDGKTFYHKDPTTETTRKMYGEWLTKMQLLECIEE
jgi:hypothetical protein